MITSYVDTTGAIRAWKFNATRAEEHGNAVDDLVLAVAGGLTSVERYGDFVAGMNAFVFDAATALEAPDSAALRATPRDITLMLVVNLREWNVPDAEQPLMTLGKWLPVDATENLIWGLFLGPEMNLLVRSHTGGLLGAHEVASDEALNFAGPNLVFITIHGDDTVTGFANGLPLTFSGTVPYADGSAALFWLGGGGFTGVVPQAAVFQGVPDVETLTDDFFYRAAPAATFQLVAAHAVGSRTIRAYLSEEPRGLSPIRGVVDALDRRAWSVEGARVIRAERIVAAPDFSPDYPDARSVDVVVDRALELGVSREIAAESVTSATGATIDPDFDRVVVSDGIANETSLAPARRARSSASRGDVAYDDRTGRFVLSPDGDLAAQGGEDSVRKRVFRRLASTLGGFSLLAGYGAGLKPKVVARSSQVAVLRAAIVRQLKKEPDLALGAVTVAILPGGVVRIAVKASVRGGELPGMTWDLRSGRLRRNG